MTRCSATGVAILLGVMVIGQTAAAQVLLPTDEPSVLCPDGPVNCNPQAHGIKLFRVGVGVAYGLGSLSLASDDDAWGKLGNEPSSTSASALELFGGIQWQLSPRLFVQTGLAYGGMSQQIETATDEYEARITYLGVPVELVTGAPRQGASFHFLVGLGLGGLLTDELERTSDGEVFDLSDRLQEPGAPGEPVEEGTSVHAWMNLGLGLSFPIGPVRMMGVARFTMSPTPIDVDANLMAVRGNFQLSAWY